MRLIISLILTALLLPMIVAAQNNDAVATWRKGNLTFDFPAEWVAEELEAGRIIALAPDLDAMQTAFTGGTLPSGQLVITIFTQTFLMENYAFEADDDLESTIKAFGRYVGGITTNFAPPSPLDDPFDREAIQVMGSNAIADYDFRLIRTDQGLLGITAVTASGEISNSAVPMQTIAETLMYVDPTPLDELELDTRYEAENGLTFSYPAEWYVLERDDQIYIYNQAEITDNTGLPAADDLAILFVDAASLSTELDIETIMGVVLAQLSEDMQINAIDEIELNAEPALRAEAVIADTAGVLMLAIHHDTLMIAISHVDSLPDFEDIILQIAASVD